MNFSALLKAIGIVVLVFLCFIFIAMTPMIKMLVCACAIGYIFYFIFDITSSKH